MFVHHTEDCTLYNVYIKTIFPFFPVRNGFRLTQTTKCHLSLCLALSSFFAVVLFGARKCGLNVKALYDGFFIDFYFNIKFDREKSVQIVLSEGTRKAQIQKRTEAANATQK